MVIQNPSQVFGQYAEKIAADFFVKKGFFILAQNFRYKKFEIDLIIKKDQLMVFVEVKARKNNLFGDPESFVKPRQIQSIHLAASQYLRIQNWKGSIRFDIISITGKIDQEIEILHFVDGFY